MLFCIEKMPCFRCQKAGNVLHSTYRFAFLLVRSSLIPTYSSRRPNNRRSQSLFNSSVSKEVGMATDIPAIVHHNTVRHSTSLFLMCPTRAAGAHPMKYNRLMPPAAYWDTPIMAVRYSTNIDPPPIPNPLIIPVATPITTFHILTVTTPPLPLRIVSIFQISGEAMLQRCCETA